MSSQRHALPLPAGSRSVGPTTPKRQKPASARVWNAGQRASLPPPDWRSWPTIATTRRSSNNSCVNEPIVQRRDPRSSGFS